jgi:hypothetical protein
VHDHPVLVLEPISVVILLKLSRKRRVMKKDVNVSHGKKMDKMVRRREL